MITVKIQGGLGNQIFQYAAGRALSKKTSQKLCLDISDYSIRTNTDKFTARKFDLDKLNIKAIKTEKSVKKLSVLTRFKNKLTGLNYFHEKGMNYNENFEFLNGNIYLEGYFQSEKYFREIRKDLLHEINNENVKTTEFLHYKNEMNKTHSVAVHIRRGDYASNAYIQSVHGTCSPEYYFNAFKKMEESGKDIRYYFFSDEPEWAMNHLAKDRNVTMVSLKQKDAHIAEMLLQAESKSNIIANSSFSWWGAWLNNHPEKMVIAPSKWYVDTVKNSQTSDLLPETWFRL